MSYQNAAFSGDTRLPGDGAQVDPITDYRGQGQDVGHRGQDVSHRGQDAGHRGQDVGHRGQDMGHGGQDVGHRGEDWGRGNSSSYPLDRGPLPPLPHRTQRRPPIGFVFPAAERRYMDSDTYI